MNVQRNDGDAGESPEASVMQQRIRTPSLQRANSRALNRVKLTTSSSWKALSLDRSIITASVLDRPNTG